MVDSGFDLIVFSLGKAKSACVVGGVKLGGHCAY